jgi:CPA2 family monovalent cation:H+ antiporter-2
VHATSFLVELLVLIAVASAGAALFERLRLPSIAGFLVAGALLGPGGLGLVEDSDRVRQLAEFGVVFLLFEIGLEMPLDLLRRLWRTVLLAGALQVGGTIAVVAVIATAFGLPGESAFVVGGLVAMSSTAVVMRLLVQRGEVDAPHGQLVVGMLLFQDLCIVPLLLAIPILAGGEAVDAMKLAGVLGRGALALVLLVVVARYVLPRGLDWAVRVRSGDLLSLASFGLVLGFAVIAQSLGLTLAVGAFTGGLLLGASPYAHQLFAEVAPVRGVLLGIFFTAVGMLFDPSTAWSAGSLLGLWVGAVVLVKTTLVFAVVAWVLRRGTRLAILTGLALAQTGEFSFVLGEAARQAGLLDPVLYQVMVAGSIVTLLATPALFALAPGLAGRLGGLMEWTPTSADRRGVPREGHVVILGYGLAGRTVARVLAASRIPYVVLDANPSSAAEARAHGEPVVFGDATRPAILERLAVAGARLVTIALSDPEATRRCVSLIHSLAPEVEIIVRTRYVSEVDALSGLGADTVVVEEFEAAISLPSRCRASRSRCARKATRCCVPPPRSRSTPGSPSCCPRSGPSGPRFPPAPPSGDLSSRSGSARARGRASWPWSAWEPPPRIPRRSSCWPPATVSLPMAAPISCVVRRRCFGETTRRPSGRMPAPCGPWLSISTG